jgi:hypothetical protein
MLLPSICRFEAALPRTAEIVDPVATNDNVDGAKNIDAIAVLARSAGSDTAMPVRITPSWLVRIYWHFCQVPYWPVVPRTTQLGSKSGSSSMARSRTPAKGKSPLRSWRVLLIRKRAQVLGYVDAPSREVAEAAAASAFSLTDEQRKRLVVQERG